MLPPPPTRLVRDDDYYGSIERNEANLRRWNLKIQCLMLIDQDRRSGLNMRVVYDH